jgi:hypothetical protein
VFVCLLSYLLWTDFIKYGLITNRFDVVMFRQSGCRAQGLVVRGDD